MHNGVAFAKRNVLQNQLMFWQDWRLYLYYELRSLKDKSQLAEWNGRVADESKQLDDLAVQNIFVIKPSDHKF
jgi:hypothetical protein